jgi:hypothetical protein
MEQDELLRRVVEILEEQGITYLLVGSLASGVYGEPRLTRDIDVVVELRPDQVARLCDAFPAADYYVSRQAAREAVVRGGQFNVIHPASGNKIDFMIARQDAWGRSQISRRRLEQILPGRPGYTAAPEDVILGKLWYYQEGGSEKHLRDIAAMLQVSGDEIDREYINHWARQLGFMAEWQAVLDRLHKR